MRIRSTRITASISATPFVLLLSITPSTTANLLTDIPKFNPLDIYYEPAPSPEEGPPLSANALRDPTYLPAEIGGIVGAYVLCISVIGIGLIIVGRRSRKIAEKLARERDIELVASTHEQRELSLYKEGGNYDPSPSTPGINPSRNFSWPSPEKTDRNPYIFPLSSKISVPGSPPPNDSKVDHRIVSQDKEMMDRNLEDLYAHVMEQEEAKANGIDVKELPLPAQLAGIGPVPPIAPQRQSSPPKKFSKLGRRPSELTIDDQKHHSRSSSLMSSLKSPGKRKTIRGKISSPVPTPLSSTFPAQASDEEPLTPRYYKPAPPVPTDQEPYYGSHNRNVSANSTSSPTRSIAEQISYDPTQPNHQNYQTHRQNKSQISVRTTSTRGGDPISASSATSQTPLYPLRTNPTLQAPPQRTPQPLQLHPTNPSTNILKSTLSPPPHPQPQSQSQTQTTRALPFRAFDPPLASPSFSHTTKTTVLERTSPLSPGLNTAGQPRTPWSALAVPYSPYQPFTPMVPVTPRLVTREERKVKERKEAKRPVLELIKSEDELWDSGY